MNDFEENASDWLWETDSDGRLVHVSALGLAAPARSGFLRSKAEAEAALLASGADGCIVRPSLLQTLYGAAADGTRRCRPSSRISREEA